MPIKPPIKPWLVAAMIATSLSTGVNAQAVDWSIFNEPFVAAAHAQAID